MRYTQDSHVKVEFYAEGEFAVENNQIITIHCACVL